MSDTLSAKILRKNVKEGAGWGGSDKVSFLVWYKGKEDWLSVFVDPKKMSAEVVQLLRDLGEGDWAEFTFDENKGKDGKTYKNIVGVVRETQMREDDGPNVQPDGRERKAEHKDSRDEMMRTSYCKDIMIAFPHDTEADLLGRVVIVKKMAKLMGE